MASDILLLLTTCMDAVSGWFLKFFTVSNGYYSLLLSILIVVLFSRFILQPLFGQRWGSGSDRVRRSRKDGD